MPRHISFSMTTPQFLAGTKDVTRREVGRELVVTLPIDTWAPAKTKAAA